MNKDNAAYLNLIQNTVESALSIAKNYWLPHQETSDDAEEANFMIHVSSSMFATVVGSLLTTSIDDSQQAILALFDEIVRGIRKKIIDEVERKKKH